MSDKDGLTTPETPDFDAVYVAVSGNDSAKVAELMSTEVKEPEAAKPEAPTEAKPEVTPPPANEEQKPEGTGVKGEAPPAKATEEPSKDEAAWIASLPEDQQAGARAHIQQLQAEKRRAEHQFRSRAGREAASQRTILELKSKLAERPQVPDLAAKPGQDSDFDALVENDPKFAAFLQRRERALLKGAAESFEKRLEEIVNPLIAGREEEARIEQESFVLEQRDILKQYVPNVEQVVASEPFKRWFGEEATEYQKQLALSPRADDGVAALQIYAGWLQRSGYSAPAAPPSPPVSSEADKIDASRQRKSQVTSGVQTSAALPPVTKSGEVTDPKALFEYYYKQIQAGQPVR